VFHLLLNQAKTKKTATFLFAVLAFLLALTLRRKRFPSFGE